MTSAETLREAARLMRERAEAATPGAIVETRDHGAFNHYFHWDPAVALAIADWLKDEADFAVRVKTVYGDDGDDIPAPLALAVARVYLGEAS